MASIQILGLPEQKEKQLLSKGLETTGELAVFFPSKYVDMRNAMTIKDAAVQDKSVVVEGTVVSKSTSGYYPTVDIQDSKMDFLTITFFGNTTYHYDKFVVGKSYHVYGKVGIRYGEYTMGNPIMYSETYLANKIVPIYPKIKGMAESYLIRCIDSAIAVEEGAYVPSKMDCDAKNCGLPDHFTAIREFHNPTGADAFKKARTRLAFEELYRFYQKISLSRKNIPVNPKLVVTSRKGMDELISRFQFQLTEDQKNAVNHISEKAMKSERIDTLITGDVGCGKTIVAIAAAMLMAENGFQSIVMAPTLVLAKQHYSEFCKLLAGTDVQCVLLTSETKKRERTKILKALESGEANILIGTSSVLSDELDFHNLGMTIIDEEHKFGSHQKEILEKKHFNGLHHISMTATPIPRSLARVIYGDSFDLISIKTMPAGRKPIITEMNTDKFLFYNKVANEVNKGHQAYVICPFIQDSESEKFSDVDSVESVKEDMEKYFKRMYPNIRIDCINGKMKQSAILKKIESFANCEFDILVSTTIVEVGVNIPNATAILIMSAERFGLSGLHQLRGRVGRSSDQGYCYLYTQKPAERLSVLCGTTSGFVIAEHDIKLRGPGDLTGEAQTGYSEEISLILKRPKLANKVRDLVFGL